jgi:hypothetical protein
MNKNLQTSIKSRLNSFVFLLHHCIFETSINLKLVIAP